MLEVEVVPADDAILDQPIAGLGDLLILFLDLKELAWIADGDIAGEAIGEFDAIKLMLDRLATFEIIDVAQDEERLDDLAERLESSVEHMLLGVAVEPPKEIGGGCFLQIDRGDQTQDVIPMGDDQLIVGVFVRRDRPGRSISILPRSECIEGPTAYALEDRKSVV